MCPEPNVIPMLLTPLLLQSLLPCMQCCLTSVSLQGSLWIVINLLAVGSLLLLPLAARYPGSLHNGQWQGTPELTQSHCRARQAVLRERQLSEH